MIFGISFFTGCVGSMLSVICGFGVGIFSMMFLPHFMSSPMTAAAVVSLTSMAQGIWIVIRYRKKIRCKDILFMGVGYVMLSTVCVYFGRNLAESTLKLGLGILMILLSVYFIFFSKKLTIRPSPVNGILTGSLGGVMSSMFGAGGPPASLYYSSAYEDKEVYLATIQAYFLITNIYVTVIRAANGIITTEVLKVAVTSIAGMIIGTFIGKKIFDKMNADAIKKAIYCLMAVSGFILIAGAL